MNKKRFDMWMGAVDSDLLEEAQRTPEHSHSWLRIAGPLAAACFCLLLAGHFLLRPGDDPSRSSDAPPVTGYAQIANPMREVTAAEVAQLGYTIPLPDGAREVSYFLIDSGDQEKASMAEAAFEQDGRAYTCRALKTAQPEDISGIYADWTQSLDWSIGPLAMQLRQSDGEAAWVGWYAPDVGVQWCLSGGEDALSLLHTAQSIVETLGYDMAAAPAGADDVVYNAFALDDLTVGETTFSLDGISYSYRTASTGVVEEDFADISGIDETYRNQAAAEVAWCQAKLYYDDGGAGKIIWFDIVPGLLYSLSMDQGASESALLEMANRLYVPAQGDVG